MSLRSVLHQIVNELPVTSETKREALHAAVDAATPSPAPAPAPTPEPPAPVDQY